jgi:hypothetical protein
LAGISSGAGQAIQFHFSHSSIIKGIAIIGGTPYWCANFNLAKAYTCIKEPNLISLTELYAAVVYARSLYQLILHLI